MSMWVASFPGSPPPFLFFVRARGEPGNEASMWVGGQVSSGECECVGGWPGKCG